MSLSEINLLIQTLILFILLVSFVFKIKRKFVIHGTLMLITVIFAIFAFLFLSPSLISEKATTLPNYILQFFDSPLLFTLFIFHTIITIFTVLLGVWVVCAWRFRAELFCAPKRKIMKLIFIIWILGYILGILIFFINRLTFNCPLSPIL